MRGNELEESKSAGFTRRKWIAGAGLAAGGLVLPVREILAAGVNEISHSEEAIHQEVSFQASRKQIYETLTSTEKFDKVVKQGGTSPALGNQPTQIARELGGTFTLFGGHIIGRHLEMVPNERLVQAWRVADWAPGAFSVARFVLKEDGAGTQIIFDHMAFPKGLADHLAEGWRLHYWQPMTQVLAG
jgi:activator of HSP90 ATPase